ncbi:SGNH/GDSL hydrolase family protein [Acetobacteraceae bacterium KSS8]|uniref:SGNH/GDSL hydrolase family protein n=1 Tax=Endosaccharibacter trunci TaxID=2812733 RepID=A0ABT1W9Z6_9PROT|nr:SGNH/GDSL hydrolase family protein [Acetobacteraceae bacterium KSS8]
MSAARSLPRWASKLGSGGPVRITCFGSSTTEGYGASAPERSYPEVMRRRLEPFFPRGLVLNNRGISGESALEMDGRIDDVIRTEPDLVIWQTGSNDVSRPVPLALFEHLTRDGLQRLRDAGAEIAIMDQQYSTALEAFDTLPEFIRSLHALAEAFGAPVFPRYALMRAWCDEGRFTIDTLSPDGTHMTDEGYRLLGEAVADWLLTPA